MKTRIVCAFLILSIGAFATACNGSTAPSPAAAPSSQSRMASSTPTVAGERVFTSVVDLSSELTLNGVRCAAVESQTQPASTGDCELPSSNSTSGVSLHLTVWKDRAAAERGVAAWVDYLTTANRITGDRSFLLTDSNWMLDFGNQGVAAEQVKNVFGGEVTKVA